MQDALANGKYVLHFSGVGGLTDLAGNPLAGNDPSGDYVVPFTVAAHAPGHGGKSAPLDCPRDQR